LKQYDDGDYLPAAKSLQTALDQGLSSKDQVTAHKHLAFIHCSENRTDRCRQEFRKALTLDPSLDLSPAEAGHPIWGPIFQNVKAGREAGRWRHRSSAATPSSPSWGAARWAWCTRPPTRC